MQFNSLDFAIFLPIVFILYWFITNKNLKLQNLLIVVASYVFYGWWDWKFLSLIFISSLLDFVIGLGLGSYEENRKRKALLWISIIGNIGILGFFKYFNFFIANFTSAFTFFGLEITASSLNVVLPVGISFYTFQTMSYSIDVYKRNLVPTKDFIAFSAFVSFFPQLVAGPIERATHLLPQFYSKRFFDYSKAVDGTRQILWGLFKKVVIADSCAEYANLIFDGYTDYPGSTLLLGAIFFSFQIYGDFSGYSDIAIGTAKLFGFDLMQNFNYPYFSKNMVEFWRRWHISLFTWFRDYLYIPLGGSKAGKWMKIRNTFIVFIISGFWHGANWTFITWGLINAIYLLPHLLKNITSNNTIIATSLKPNYGFTDLLNIISTFCLTALAWIFFRAESMTQALNYISEIFSTSLFTIPKFEEGSKVFFILLLILAFILTEWHGRKAKYAIANLGLTWVLPLRWLFYFGIIAAIFISSGTEQKFIYFQF